MRHSRTRGVQAIGEEQTNMPAPILSDATQQNLVDSKHQKGPTMLVT